MYTKLYENINLSTCFISVFLGEERISTGTGFAFLSEGQVITAAHVVTGRLPINRTDYEDPTVSILCKFSGIPLIEYKVAFCGMTVIVPEFKDSIQIDLAILIPKEQPGKTFTFLPAQTFPPSLGEEVFLAGFSDELKLPFQVDELLDRSTKGAHEFFEAMNKGYMVDMTGPLIKRAVVGNIRRIEASNEKEGATLRCDVIYLDNGMHYGASGGPLVNIKGEAVGVIVMRAITDASQLEAPKIVVPSGSTVALSLQPLQFISQKA